MLANDSPLDDPHHQAYITLTLCCILHTQQVDGVASKRNAAHWMKDTYGEALRRSVGSAEQWDVGQQLALKGELRDLLRFTLAQIGRIAAD